MQTVEEIRDVVDTTYEDVTPGRQASGFDISSVKTESDVNAALLRGLINKEEADNLREIIIKTKAAEDIAAAVEHSEQAAGGELFPKK